jgi:hypothetical protein
MCAARKRHGARARQKDVLCTKVCKERENNDGGHILPAPPTNQRFILIRTRARTPRKHSRDVFLLLFSRPYEFTEVEAILSRALFSLKTLSLSRAHRRAGGVAHYSKSAFVTAVKKLRLCAFFVNKACG